MSRSWSILSERQRERMRHRFALNLAADALVAPEEPPEGIRPARFDQLYAAARDPLTGLTEPVVAALSADDRGRAAYEALLRDGAVCWFPPAAAAAGPAGLDAREEAGFRIWLRPSSAGHDQVYVLIRAAEGLAVKTHRHRRPAAGRAANLCAASGRHRRSLSAHRARGFAPGARHPRFRLEAGASVTGYGGACPGLHRDYRRTGPGAAAGPGKRAGRGRVVRRVPGRHPPLGSQSPVLIPISCATTCAAFPAAPRIVWT